VFPPESERQLNRLIAELTEEVRALRRLVGEPKPAPRGKSQKNLLTRKEAAATLSMSLNHFERYVQPHLKIVRTGRLRLVPPAELQRWIDLRAERVPR
jgi:excisionase family DNA binding protein